MPLECLFCPKMKIPSARRMPRWATELIELSGMPDRGHEDALDASEVAVDSPAFSLVIGMSPREREEFRIPK
jgi:hypothetical protein